MNDMIMVYFDYDANELQESLKVEKDIQYLDELVQKYGWKYSGVMNMYIPIVKETRDETVDKVMEAIKSDERLKKYFFCREAQPWQETEFIFIAEPQLWVNLNKIKGWEKVKLSVGTEVELSHNFVKKFFCEIPTAAMKCTF